MTKGWLVVALVLLAALAGGCASMFSSSSTGFVELEPSKPNDSKSSKLKNVAGASATSNSAQDVSLTTQPADSWPVFDTTARDRRALALNQTPAGSGFPPFVPGQTGASTNDLGELAAELRAGGVLSPAEQQALLDDLQQTDPALWPKLVHQFRLALAYRTRGEGPGARGAGLDSAPTDATNTTLGSDANSAAAPNAPSVAGNVEPALTDKNRAAPISAATTNSLASDEPLLGEPGLRPPRKSGEKKTDDRLAVGKARDSDKSNSAAKGSAEPAAPVDSPLSGESQLQLTKAILAIEGEASRASGRPAAAELARQMQLRMLYLAAGRRDDALRPIPGLSNAQQDFWTKEIYGLATYLDQERSGATDHSAGSDRRAAEAALHLRDAADRLGELAPPAVRNLAFCKEVTSFGVFKKFPKYEFKAGDEALLYCEIENLKSESSDKGFRTSVKGRYEILDSRGERLAEQEFPASDDYCSRPRRDFFIPYFVTIPKRISEGEYTLKLTVEDAQAQRTGEASIQFSIK